MAQVNAFNFQQTPQNLAAINNVRPDYMGAVWDWQQRAQQHDQTGLADLMRASQHEATMDPIRVQQGQATLADTQAGTAGKLLHNEDQRMKNEVAQHVLPQAKLQAAKDLILKGSEADEKMFAIEVDKMLRSNDPKQRSYGEQLLNTSRKAVEEKRAAESQRLTNQQRIELEGKQRMREIGAQGANQKEVAQIGADSRLEVARLKAKDAAKGVLEAVQSGKMNYEKAATSLFLLGNLSDEGDPNKKTYLELASKMEQANLAAKNAGAKPQVDMEAMGIATTTPQASPVLGAPVPAVAERPARQAATQRITIYKDGKAVGTIPQEQKDQAIKEGYSVK